MWITEPLYGASTGTNRQPPPLAKASYHREKTGRRSRRPRALPHGLAPGASTFRPWASASFVGARHIFPCTLAAGDATATRRALQEIGRASCREGVCQDV